MTDNEYKEIDEAIDKAQDSVVPFPVSTDDELSVVGDANRTELNKHDITITFLIPGEKGYTKHVKEFKDVYITPRQNPSIIKVFTAIMPFFRKGTKDGNVVQFTTEEKVEIAQKFDQGIYDTIYDLVAVVLKIDDDLKDYMTPNSVMEAAVKIMLQYPEMVNEADTFFG